MKPPRPNSMSNVDAVPDDRVSDLAPAIYDTIGSVAPLVEEFIRNEQAQRHCNKGIIRRLFVIRINVCEIIKSVDAAKDRPLHGDDEHTLTMNLNSLYVQLHGTLDNLAWCLVYELNMFGSLSEEKQEDRRKIALFGKTFMQKLDPESRAFLAPLVEWHNLMKELRDPIAHRIPLCVVGRFFTDKERDDFNALSVDAITAIAKGDGDGILRILGERGMLGTFRPFFAHESAVGPFFRPILPQMAQDVRHLLKIVSFFLNKCKRRKGEG